MKNLNHVIPGKHKLNVKERQALAKGFSYDTTSFDGRPCHIEGRGGYDRLFLISSNKLGRIPGSYTSCLTIEKVYMYTLSGKLVTEITNRTGHESQINFYIPNFYYKNRKKRDKLFN